MMSGLVPLEKLFSGASAWPNSPKPPASQFERPAVSMSTDRLPLPRADSDMSTTTLDNCGQPGQPLQQPLEEPDLSLCPASSLDPLWPDAFQFAGLGSPLQLPDTQEQPGSVSRHTADAPHHPVAVALLPQHCSVGDKSAAADPPVISIPEAAWEIAKQQTGLDVPDLCDSCRTFLLEGDELASRIQADRLSNEVKQQTGSFVLRAVCGCTKVASSSGEPSNPCLFADREHLASSSIGRNWGLVLSKARDAEAGRRRAPNGTQQPWNINFGTNSPMLLQQQGALLLALDPSSSTGSNSSAHSTQTAGTGSGAAASGRRPCGKVPGLYCVHSTDTKALVTAYAVACYGNVPAVRVSGATMPAAAAAAGLGAGAKSRGRDLTSYLWCSKMKCSKRSHALHHEELELFRYALVVFTSKDGAAGGAFTPQKKKKLDFPV